MKAKYTRRDIKGQNNKEIKLNSNYLESKDINNKKIFIKKPLTVSNDKHAVKEKVQKNISNTDSKPYRHVQIRAKLIPNSNILLSPNNNDNLKTIPEKNTFNYINTNFYNTIQGSNNKNFTHKTGTYQEINNSMSNIIHVKKKFGDNNISLQNKTSKIYNNYIQNNNFKKKFIYQKRIKNILNKDINKENDGNYNNDEKSYLNNEELTKTEKKIIKNTHIYSMSPTCSRLQSKMFSKNDDLKSKDSFLLLTKKKENNETLNYDNINIGKKYRKKMNSDIINDNNQNNQTVINKEQEKDNDFCDRKIQTLNNNENNKENDLQKEKRRYIYINRKIRSNKNDIKKNEDNSDNKNKKDMPIVLTVGNFNTISNSPLKIDTYFLTDKNQEDNNDIDDTNLNINNNTYIDNKNDSKHYKTKSSVNDYPLHTLKFLVHKANEIEELGDSFGKYYLSNPISARNIHYRTRTYINKKTQLNDYIIDPNTKLSSISDVGDSNSNDIISEEKKHFKKYNNIFNHNYNNNEKQNINYTNKIINNNTYNTTVNFYKINQFPSDINKKILGSKNSPNILEHKRASSDHPVSYSNLLEHLLNSKERKSHYKNKNEINNNSICKEKNKDLKDEYQSNKYDLDLEILYILEAKLKCVLSKINKYNVCYNECFDWINYYFSCNFYEKEINIFKLNHNKKNIEYNMKVELLCYFLCYDVSFNENFNQTGILFKTIFNLLHINFLILISYIIYDNKNNDNFFIKKLNETISRDLKIKLTSQDMNENNILSIISNNYREINNYYKMIIDNLYSNYYSISNNEEIINNKRNLNKFPNCLSLDVNALNNFQKLKIISIFFFDAYRLLYNYNFEDLKNFFDLYLDKSKEKDLLMPYNDLILVKRQKNNDKKISIYNYNINNNLKNNLNNKYIFNENKYYNNIIIDEFYLPPISNYYKYTLVLDLDETLIYFQRDNTLYDDNFYPDTNNKNIIIFRPGLIEFLQKMKPLYELVLFSFGTKEYVNHILNIIEKKEKFFEYVLYRNHATFEKGDYVKNLELLGRDLKRIIIVDNIPHVFKLQKSNGICIKSFYGDVISERNTLKLLGKILEKIRFDADEEGDIRKSLKKQKNLIFTHITTNLEY